MNYNNKVGLNPYNRKVKISLRQRVRGRQLNVAVVFLTPLLTKRWTTRRFHFVVYYNDNEYEHMKNTRNDDASTQKFRSRTRCRSEILTSLIIIKVNDYHCPERNDYDQCREAFHSLLLVTKQRWRSSILNNFLIWRSTNVFCSFFLIFGLYDKCIRKQ